MMNVPFVDLKIQYATIKSEVDTAIADVISETAFIGGKYVNRFAKNFAGKYGVKHCIPCANGTDAIYITLVALGISQGDEVITVANSWISTAETISQAGAKPVFVDIEPDYYHIDENQIESKVTDRTKAIIPVHLYGQPANIKRIAEIARKYNLVLIEDCAQAHFAEFDGAKAGTFGNAATFSYYPGKNLGAYGDGGAILTNEDELYEKVRMYANHGSLVKHQHRIEGINSRLDGLQAAILDVKLKYILEWNRRRLENALYLNKKLSAIDEITIPKIRENAVHVFHLYVIRTEKRDELAIHLKEKGIDTGVHYPIALPFMKAYEYLGHTREDFPVAHHCMDRILSLPMFPELTKEQMEFMVEEIKNYITRK